MGFFATDEDFTRILGVFAAIFGVFTAIFKDF